MHTKCFANGVLPAKRRRGGHKPAGIIGNKKDANIHYYSEKYARESCSQSLHGTHWILSSLRRSSRTSFQNSNTYPDIVIASYTVRTENSSSEFSKLSTLEPENTAKLLRPTIRHPTSTRDILGYEGNVPILHGHTGFSHFRGVRPRTAHGVYKSA